MRGSKNITMHQGTLEDFPDHDDPASEWHQVWMPWMKSLPFHFDFGCFRAVHEAMARGEVDGLLWLLLTESGVNILRAIPRYPAGQREIVARKWPDEG